MGCDIFSCDYTLPQSRNVGSVDAGFILALPFHHGDLEPGCVSTRGWLMCGIKIPPQDFPLKMQGGAYVRGGAYLRDTTVHCTQLHVDIQD